MVDKRATPGASKKGRLHRFYLIGSAPDADVEGLAEKLIALKPVEEVFLSDGDCGFLVKVRFIEGKEPPDIAGYLKGRIAARYGTVNSYYQYRNLR